MSEKIYFGTEMTKFPKGCKNCTVIRACVVHGRLNTNQAFGLQGAEDAYYKSLETRPYNCPLHTKTEIVASFGKEENK